MSIWTNVCGNIIIDFISENDFESLVKKVQNSLGRTYDYGDSELQNLIISDKKTHIPIGSEGSVRYTITRYKSETSLCVSISGNLRDYGYDKKEVFDDFSKWLNFSSRKIDYGLKLSIRNGILLLNVGDFGNFVTYYNVIDDIWSDFKEV